MPNLPSRGNKEQYVHEMFNAIAARYDLLNTMMSLGMDNSWRRFAVKQSRVGPGDNVLDICCGTGKFIMELAQMVGTEGHVTGLDFSEKMLAIAREALDSFEFKESVTLVQGNAMQLPFPNNSFDAVTVGWGLRNVPDIVTVLKEMMRVVKPGGMVVSLDMAKPETPIFKEIYWIFFGKIVPFMGRIWAKKESAYAYLHDSAKAFPPQKELVELFQGVGLEETVYHNIMGGVVAVVEGRKPVSCHE